MITTIQIEVRNVYGVKTLYPANDQAKLLAKLAGTKTLTNTALAVAEQMGFSIVTVAQAAPRWKDAVPA